MSKCDLIRDLLPLYVDGAASKESARAVEEHVATCYECRRALQDMRAPTPSPAPDEEDMSFAVSLGQLREMRAKRRARYILLGIVVAAVLFALGMALFPPPENPAVPLDPAPSGAPAPVPSDAVPLEDYDVSLVQFEDGTLMGIYHALRPIYIYSFNYELSGAHDIMYFYIQTAPEDYTGPQENEYAYWTFETDQEGWQTSVQEIRKGIRKYYEVIYRAGDEIPYACDELVQNRDDLYSPEGQAALAYQVALNHGEAQPTATP